jgi:hypothetical protein
LHIDCIRERSRLGGVPVAHYSLDAKRDPPEELAALVTAAATMSDVQSVSDCPS